MSERTMVCHNCGRAVRKVGETTSAQTGWEHEDSLTACDWNNAIPVTLQDYAENSRVN